MMSWRRLVQTVFVLWMAALAANASAEIGAMGATGATGPTPATQVVAPAASGPIGTTGPVQFQGQPTGGSSTLLFADDGSGGATGYTGTTGVTAVSVYQFSATYTVTDGTSCNARTVLDGTPLMISTGTGTTFGSAPAKPSANTPYSITLAQPLVAGTQLCLSGVENNAPFYSAIKTVVDASDYGRFRATFTAGVMVTNQQSASNSSTAGEYLDMELVTSLIRGGLRPCTKNLNQGCKPITDPTGKITYRQGYRFMPGFNTFFNARLSPIPVSTTTTTTNTSTAATTSNLNLLTSQQAIKIQVGGNMPFRTNGWNNRTNAFTYGPVMKASFDTLLNPSAGSASTTSTSGTTSTTLTSGNFSSVYSSWLVGVRTSWDQFPASTDKSPKTLAAFEVSMGQYSNLPSFECVGKGKGGALPTGAISACTVDISRTLVPRLDISGFVTFPNYPFVLGFDANLAQYGIFAPSNIDYLNKPGNDVRIYVGYTIDLSTAFKMLYPH
jgi:hypothetical protein